MNYASLKKQLRAAIFGIFGIVLVIIVIRIVLKALGANTEAAFVKFWYDISEFFVAMFRGMYPNLENPSSGRIILEVFSVIALLFYLIVAFLVSKFATSAVAPSGLDIVKNIVDSIFKLLEFLLIARFLLKLTAAGVASGFVSFIYNVSSVVYEPFAGILPQIRVGEYGIVFETSTLIAIIVIILFDLISEGIFENLRGDDNLPSTHVAPAPVPMQAAPQNITISIPQQQQHQPAPAYIDQRTINVVPPQQHHYPGYGQNQLNNQPPQQQYIPPAPQQYYPQPQPGHDATRVPQNS